MSEKIPDEYPGMYPGDNRRLILLPPPRHRRLEELSPAWRDAVIDVALFTIPAMEKAITNAGAQVGTS